MATSQAMLTKNANAGGSGPHRMLTRKKAEKLARDDDTPLDVMVENMLFWRSKAAELEQILTERLEAIRLQTDGLTDAQQQDPDFQREMARTLAQVKDVGQHFLKAREEAQRCAVDAAPYVHPRIAPTKIEGSDRAAARMIQKDQSPQEMIANYLDSLAIVDIQEDAADTSEAAEQVAS